MKIKVLILLLSLISIKLFGGIEGYFKKIIDKSNSHQIRNIDFIYMINLDERPEKLASCRTQLDPFEVYPYRFSAVNGWKLSLEVINDLGVKFEPWMSKDFLGSYYIFNDGLYLQDEIMHVLGKTYFAYHMNRGPIGIVLSHLSVLQDAYDSGYQTIWVMEDDIQVIQNPNLISSTIDDLDSLVGHHGWDILFTDQDTKDKQGNYVICLSYAPRPNFEPIDPYRFYSRQIVSSNFKKIGARYGAYSMIIRRSGIKKILDFFKKNKIFYPYDMEFFLPPDIQIFTVIEDIVSTEPQALSDNAKPNYKF
jgi:GR25 family glycosyltransferase involved in LPS biosynthesis